MDKFNLENPTYYTRDAVNGILSPKTTTDKEYLFGNAIATTSTDALALLNNTDALVGTTVQMSPRLRFRGSAWDTDDAVSRTTDWIIENLPVSGTTVSSQLRFGHSLAGGSYTYPFYLDNVGNINTTANLKLPTTSSTAGQIQINGNRYFHAYSPVQPNSNLFIGYNAGNFTMSGTEYQASYNIGIGYYSLQMLTSGKYNSAFGNNSLSKNQSGNNNTAIGNAALYGTTTASENTAVGCSSLSSPP